MESLDGTADARQSLEKEEDASFFLVGPTEA